MTPSNIKNKKGTISIPIVTAISIGMLIIGGITTYFTTQGSISARASLIEGDVKVLKNEDINLNKRFDSFEKNINIRFDSFEATVLQAIKNK